MIGMHDLTIGSVNDGVSNYCVGESFGVSYIFWLVVRFEGCQRRIACFRSALILVDGANVFRQDILNTGVFASLHKPFTLSMRDPNTPTDFQISKCTELTLASPYWHHVPHPNHAPLCPWHRNVRRGMRGRWRGGMDEGAQSGKDISQWIKVAKPTQCLCICEIPVSDTL